MITLTKMQFALVAAVASLMTSAMYAFIQAFIGNGYDLINTFGFVIGRTVGDIPLMVFCFIVAYLLAMRLSVRAK